MIFSMIKANRAIAYPTNKTKKAPLKLFNEIRWVRDTFLMSPKHLSGCG